MPKLEIVTNVEAKRSEKKRHIWPMSNSGGIYLYKERVADRMNRCSQHRDHGLSTGGTRGHQHKTEPAKERGGASFEH